MKKILVVLFEGVELLELSPFIDIFGWNNIVNKNKILVTTLGDFEKIKSCWNLTLSPEIVFDDSFNNIPHPIKLESFDAIIFPGGFVSKGYFNAFKSSPFLVFLKKHLKNKDLKIPYLIGVCTGSFVLKELGVLKGKRATTYLRENEVYFKQLFTDEIIPVRENIVIDGNIITSSGPSTAVDLAFFLLEKLTNLENCNIIKREMGFDILKNI